MEYYLVHIKDRHINVIIYTFMSWFMHIVEWNLKIKH